jgi:hypothetical protein
VTGLLAYCVACTVKPERGTASDWLAAAVALEMAQWWQPTAAGYLGRVSKTLIIEAVTEAKGKAPAENIAALKKGDMADRTVELLAGTGWLPAMLRGRVKRDATILASVATPVPEPRPRPDGAGEGLPPRLLSRFAETA